YLLYGYLWKNFETERSTVLVERDTLQSQVFELEVETNTLAQELTEARAELEGVDEEQALNKELDSKRELQNDLRRNLSVLIGKKELELERQKEEEVVRVIPVDLQYVKNALDLIQKDQGQLLKAIDECTDLTDLVRLREKVLAVQNKLTELTEKAEKGSVKETKTISLPVAEKQASDKRIASYEKEISELKEELIKAEAFLASAEAQILTGRETARAKREAFFAKEQAWRDKGQMLGKLKDNLNEVKVRLARVEVREEDLTKLVSEELHVPVDTLKYDGTPVEREKLEREIARLKVEVEHIGSIDPEVVKEYQETEERYSFLSHESGDLRQAMASLETVIGEMDHKIEVAFKKAFHEIRSQFSENFKIIFGGGKADLSLVTIQKKKRGNTDEEDGEDMGEEIATETMTGIEIAACPPGKKITNLSMLSGGERSLTSLALLFAIISYNPPPFAVLDEVEAALDEANSRRFGKMLRELSKHTQFIAITHNRETMAQASLLYGVTMGADGISQLLSVHLD
ncbi:MAG: AAA family ATPase, partial [Patescibacteria group bacterium]